MSQLPYTQQPPPVGFNIPPVQPGYPAYSNQPMYPPPQAGYMPQSVPMQPIATGNFMPFPQVNIPNCPPGLEYLTQIDQLIVKQKVELLEAFVGFETKNKYSIMNSMGQKVYYAKEDTDCCTRNCCGPIRPFNIEITDNNKRRVLTLDRPFRCQSCFFFCCLQTLNVYDANGSLLGSVNQNWSILAPSFSVKNASGETVLKIKGPICTFSICGDVVFHLLSRDEKVVVGQITKQWSGLARELFTDSDHFGISFAMDLDVSIKAVLLGALFLTDFMFFEKKNNKESNFAGML